MNATVCRVRFNMGDTDDYEALDRSTQVSRKSSGNVWNQTCPSTVINIPKPPPSNMLKPIAPENRLDSLGRFRMLQLIMKKRFSVKHLSGIGVAVIGIILLGMAVPASAHERGHIQDRRQVLHPDGGLA